jgi:hypothetical protein
MIGLEPMTFSMARPPRDCVMPASPMGGSRDELVPIGAPDGAYSFGLFGDGVRDSGALGNERVDEHRVHVDRLRLPLHQ